MGKASICLGSVYFMPDAIPEILHKVSVKHLAQYHMREYFLTWPGIVF